MRRWGRFRADDRPDLVVLVTDGERESKDQAFSHQDQ